MMFEVLIKNGTVVDGSGCPGYAADIGIRNGKITILRGGSAGVTAKKIIDAAGKVVCPGFIDAHSHADLFFGEMPHSLGKTNQGVTTEICGHCGTTDFPTATNNPEFYKSHVEDIPRVGRLGHGITDSFKLYRQYIERVEKTTHIHQLAGHHAIRRSVMGTQNRAPTDRELGQMKDLLRECLDNGAAGLSSGLIYPPGAFAQKEELAELCKVVAEYGGVYTTHMRDEGRDVLHSVREALDTAGEANCKLTISHHKACGYKNWGQSTETLRMIDDAIAGGQKVALDVYPFMASMTSLYTCLPVEEFEFSLDQRVARLKNPVTREEIKRRLFAGGASSHFDELRSLDDALMITCRHTPEHAGKTVGQLAKERGISEVDALFDILIENRYAISAAFFMMCKEDLCRIFMHDSAMLCTDALIYSATDPTHPRGFCSFPEVIDLFVKREKLLTMEQAVQKMTSKAADWYGLKNKGYIRDGYDADLVIIDPKTVASGFTFGEKVKPCPGIEKVFVDGIPTYENYELTGNTPGRFLPAK